MNKFDKPSPDQYNFFMKALPKANIDAKWEAAMFLAQLIHESGGLKLVREDKGKEKKYDGDDPSHDLFYYGRGYIQLTHNYNYKAASQALYGDDSLLDKPDLVASDQQVSWDTSSWFWKANVHDHVKGKKFGLSTKCINPMECTNQSKHYKARNRFKLYKVVLRAFSLNLEIADETGCYN